MKKTSILRITPLALIAAGLLVQVRGEEMITIPKEGLQELERKEYELEELSGELNKSRREKARLENEKERLKGEAEQLQRD